MPKHSITPDDLIRKIKSRNIKIAVVGLGYVGLPLAVEFARNGIAVIGIDINPAKIKGLRAGKSHVQDVPDKDIADIVKNKKLIVTTKFESVKSVQAIIICVPTPLNRVKEPDLSFILHATDGIRKYLTRGQIIILESTTYPGTTEEVILPKLTRKGYRVGEDFFLCFSPERIDPGNQKFPMPVIPKVVGGITPQCVKVATALYGQVFYRVVPVSSSRTAEMAKLLENTFRIVNIGLINELAMIAERLGVDIWEAIDAAKTKPFGFMPFYPGPGVGGHCIGIDPIYLSWKAKRHGFDVRFIELAREINTNMPAYVVRRITEVVSKRLKKDTKKTSVLIVGVTYKRNVADTRESPAIEIIEQLLGKKFQVTYFDKFVPSLRFKHVNLKSKPLTENEIKKHDIAVIVTDHSDIDYGMVIKHSKVVLDTRNVLRSFQSAKVVRL
ncbi:MAG: UDP-N-acetyl-D-glucosamine dehydrogenase [Candidatus Omnitrophica bacterium CG11_big_fil_rev_8_21_14_0_20_45_26]|uniref:UDP-N-acetyl-D-glucosamine dehydrogenase n=1 Tax=Candidatus Abzuiibacterium crystallinum TaxID=1974748 RepID=A0A2H0LLS4_9BACT|nr:MAG: UDP-N-acetyl-D-glucosamine dehydrogenase [Candidatus Omnitrophica bacterium CG11_big_fil_rev_8_21_14_0_20_45_26]PIW63244.1 MAG: UDP-N-acetyl-D-glucosamine dehydrogenase [Candidatus Omnitrophica bacterium CG12_big_fil_rev_8_21_14_0_65_45_16]